MLFRSCLWIAMKEWTTLKCFWSVCISVSFPGVEPVDCTIFFFFFKKLHPHSAPACTSGTWQTGRGSISPFICEAKPPAPPPNSPGRSGGEGEMQVGVAIEKPLSPQRGGFDEAKAAYFLANVRSRSVSASNRGEWAERRWEINVNWGLFRVSLIRPKMSSGQGTRPGLPINASAASQEVPSDVKGQRLKPLSACQAQL